MLLPEFRESWPDDFGYGIEIELEKMIQTDYYDSNYWTINHDGSLRDEGRELTLKGPLSGPDVYDALLEADRMLKIIFPLHKVTERCGLHVHLDVRHFIETKRENEDFHNMIAAFVMFEQLLYLISGNRTNNKNCVPTYYDGMKTAKIALALSGDDIQLLQGGRYAGLNFRSILQRGSLEVRMAEGTANLRRIYDFTRILGYIRATATSHKLNEDAFFLHVSKVGVLSYLHEVFPDDLVDIITQVNYENALLFGIRQIQGAHYYNSIRRIDMEDMNKLIPEDRFPRIPVEG